jgi:phage terminase large subunit
MEARVRTGYRPRPLQYTIHRSLKRFNVLVCHRRFGKTVLAVNHLLDKALRLDKPNPRVAYIAPLYKQAKRVAWDYAKQYAVPVPGSQVNESELRIDFPGGARLSLYGADNPDSLRGVYLDAVVLDEYAQMRPNLWGEVIRPALSDRQGGALFIGTPQGHNEFYEKYRDALKDPVWFAAVYRASETGILPADELASARKDMTEDEYEQEYECSFEAAIRGAYYGREMREATEQGRVGVAPHEPALPVHTAWDLGIGDSTAIWFAQFVGKEVRLIDFYEAHGQALPHYAKVLQGKPYVYGDHWLPHDARVRELGTGKTRVETLANLGIKGTIAPNLDIEDGINAVRLTLGKCWFDDRCKQGIEALRQYRADEHASLTDPQTKRAMFRDTPLHDWSSHAADAFRYLCVAYRQEAGLAKPPLGNAGYVVLPGLPKQWRSERV